MQKSDEKGWVSWKIGAWCRKFHKIPIVYKASDKKLMINVRGTDIWFNKRAKKPQNRAESGIPFRENGLFQKSLLQKGFLTQNRVQKAKRAIRPRPGPLV